MTCSPLKRLLLEAKWATAAQGHCTQNFSLYRMSRFIAVVPSLGRQKGQSPLTGSQLLGGWASLPWQVQGTFTPTPEALKAPRSPQSHPACAPARGERGIREGSGFHKQEERRGGGRCSALKIDLQAFQRGPAPEIAGGGALRCPVHPKERREGK